MRSRIVYEAKRGSKAASQVSHVSCMLVPSPQGCEVRRQSNVHDEVTIVDTVDARPRDRHDPFQSHLVLSISHAMSSRAVVANIGEQIRCFEDCIIEGS